MNLAVVTLCIGDNCESIGVLTHPWIKEYASKIKADFIVINEKKLSKKYSHYEKFQIYDLLEKYDRIIYIDTDVIIRKDCPNLFDIVPEDKFGIFNEGDFLPWEHVLRDASKKYDIPFERYEGISYNTGVMVISKKHKDLFIKPNEEYDEYVSHFVFEQPYINLKLFELKYDIYKLDYKYNRMEYIDKITGESRFSSYIIHYAGIDNRNKVISKDLEEIKKNKKYPVNILISVGGGCGDQIDAEPIIRYVKEKVYPGENIRIISDWPELFSHLDIPACKRKDFIMDAGYYIMETLPSDKSILWRYLSQAICHTTDFASISCLRTIIPDRYKTIKLPVKERSFKKIDKLIKKDLEKYILLHPGRGWPSKTFPEKWWKDVIYGLRSKYDNIALIGHHINDDQGYVEFDIDESIIDLRDLLDIEDTISLISKTKCIISNDSMPIHAAGAFDNYIVLIPTCKHPDHVLPYRYGNKYYKSKALYKKLTCDYLNNKPTNITGETIDRVVGDIMDYLPDPDTVVEETFKLIGYK